MNEYIAYRPEFERFSLGHLGLALRVRPGVWHQLKHYPTDERAEYIAGLLRQKWGTDIEAEVGAGWLFVRALADEGVAA